MNAIELKGLVKEYPGFRLGGLDLALPAGSIMGLVGENGAGKSTTIKLIMNAIKRDAGSVSVLGVDNQSRAFSDIKEDIGVVLDEAYYPEVLNARNVGCVMANTYRRWEPDTYENYLQRFGLPQDKAFRDYSRGMKMKLAIAVALSHQAKLLILDEATSGLDPVVRDEVVEMFSEFTRDESHSILMSSHIVSDLEKICDYIAFLHKGKLLLCEEKDILLEEYGLIHCTREAFDVIESSAIKGKKESPYGVEALVLREAVPEGIIISPVTIEELFVFMVKEA